MTVLASRPQPPPSEPEPALLPLEPGDHLDRATFHARYEAMPPGIKAELIDGVVYMPSPVKRRHGKHSKKVLVWLDLYESATPGVEGFDNTTVILSPNAEVQPDSCLVIDAARGGQTREADDWIIGAPELVVEVASSSASYDLHSKLREYERAGVREYVVVLVREPEVKWFVKREAGYEPVAPGEGALLRSEVFPGLWLDPAALLRLDSAALRAALERGLASDEHREFVERLAAAGEGA